MLSERSVEKCICVVPLPTLSPWGFPGRTTGLKALLSLAVGKEACYHLTQDSRTNSIGEIVLHVKTDECGVERQADQELQLGLRG